MAQGRGPSRHVRLSSRRRCRGRQAHPPAAAYQRRDYEPGGNVGDARSERVAGSDAGIDIAAAVREGGPALRLARQASRRAARHDRGGGRTRDPLHHRHSHRHRRDAGRADRLAAGDRRAAPASRPHPGSHHPELPRQGRYADGARRRTGDGRSALDCGRRAADPRPADEHPVAAQSQLRRLPAASVGGDQ